MKVLIVICAIFVAANTTPLKSPIFEDKNAAYLRLWSLTEENDAVLGMIQMVRKNVKDTLQQLDEKLDAVDYKIKEHPIIKQVEEISRKYSSKQGAKSCAGLVNVNEKILYKDLKDFLTLEVNSTLNDIKITLHSTNQEHLKIQEEIQSKQLEDELKLCKNRRCVESKTKKYQTTIEQSKKVIVNLNNITDSVVQQTLITVKPKVDNLIKIFMYEPFVNCIKKLRD